VDQELQQIGLFQSPKEEPKGFPESKASGISKNQKAKQSRSIIRRMLFT